jgi:hypothetical protein
MRPITKGLFGKSRRKLDHFKMNLRENYFVDEMSGGRNWLKILGVKGFGLSGFCSQTVFGSLLSCWLVV